MIAPVVSFVAIFDGGICAGIYDIIYAVIAV